MVYQTHPWALRSGRPSVVGIVRLLFERSRWEQKAPLNLALSNGHWQLLPAEAPMMSINLRFLSSWRLFQGEFNSGWRCPPVNHPTINDRQHPRSTQNPIAWVQGRIGTVEEHEEMVCYHRTLSEETWILSLKPLSSPSLIFFPPVLSSNPSLLPHLVLVSHLSIFIFSHALWLSSLLLRSVVLLSGGWLPWLFSSQVLHHKLHSAFVFSLSTEISCLHRRKGDQLESADAGGGWCWVSLHGQLLSQLHILHNQANNHYPCAWPGAAISSTNFVWISKRSASQGP